MGLKAMMLPEPYSPLIILFSHSFLIKSRLQLEMRDLDYVHIYEPAIHLMSTYVSHAVAWLVQNGLPSLSWGHSGP
jgi:hypothetical protein